MKYRFLLVMVAVLLIASASLASADFTGPYDDTTFVFASSTNFPVTNQLGIFDSTGSCTDSNIAYVQFSAATIGTVDTATLQFKVLSEQIPDPVTPTLALYGVTDFAVTNAALGSAPQTTALTPLASVVVATDVAVGTILTFTGSGLVNYIQSQADGDDVVTLALSFSQNCGPISTILSLHSEEATAAGDRPVLTITGTQPNAVTISNFSADGGSTPNWLLYGGIAGVAVLALGAVMVLRRKAA